MLPLLAPPGYCLLMYRPGTAYLCTARVLLTYVPPEYCLLMYRLGTAYLCAARVLLTCVPPGYCLLMYRPVASTTNAPTSLMYRPGNNAPTSLMYCPVASKFLLFSSRISSSRSASCSSNKPATASLQLLKPTQGRGYTRAQQRGAASAAHWEGVCFVVARGVMFMHSLGAPGTHLIDYRY